MSSESIIVANRLTHNIVKKIDPETIAETYQLINGRIIMQSSKINNGRYNVTFKDDTEECNVVKEILNMCPMYCNLLLSRKYSNILFISHVDINETKWYKDGRPSDKIPSQTKVDGYPPSKTPSKNYGDIDKIMHFIPVIMKSWPYEIDFKVAKPQQPRYGGTMHLIYDRFGVKKHRSSCQYEHGTSAKNWRLLDHDGNNFDAVVFLNVPTLNNKSFSLKDVKSTFKSYVSDDCEFVDIWDGDNTGRFENDTELTVNGDISQVLNLRYEQERKILTEEDLFLKRHISVYK